MLWTPLTVLSDQSWGLALVYDEEAYDQQINFDDFMHGWGAAGAILLLALFLALLFLAVFRQLTKEVHYLRERERAEEALRQSADIVNNIQVGLHIYHLEDINDDRTLMMDTANKAAEDITGVSIGDVVGNTLDESFPGLREMGIPRQYAEVVRTGKPVELDEVYYGDDRVIHSWFRVKAFPLPNNCVGVAFENITKQKKTEKSLRESEEKFLQAQKMEAIGHLAGGIAHDFNNLLTTIIGYSDMLLGEHPTEGSHRDEILEIRKAGERASSLTQQLLAFSRKQVLRPKVVELNSLIVGFGRMLRRLIGEDVTLSTNLDSDLGLIKADPGQLEQVLMNLVINARDSMPGGGRLSMDTSNTHLDDAFCQEHSDAKPGDYVLLTISDTGHGIDAETKEHIFEPFFTTKGVGKGTGLGLSTVYGIVKQSGGYIWFQSELDYGTSFKIYFPQAEREEKQQHKIAPAEKAVRGTETLLLVEDDEALLTLACKILEQHNYTVLKAIDGSQALEIADKTDNEQIALLITDVVMPEMSGKELSDRLIAKYPYLKVLYISGYTDNAIAQYGVLDEGVSLLQKPFSPQSLAEKVREVLDEE